MVICLLVWLPWQQKAPIDMMGNRLNCIFSIINEACGSYDQLIIVYPVCDSWTATILFRCHDNIKFYFFKMTTSQKRLKQYDSNLVQMLLGKRQFKIAKTLVIPLLVWLPWQQKVLIDLQWEKGLNFIFSITSEMMWTKFDSYDHLMTVCRVMCFITSGHFVWLPW